MKKINLGIDKVVIGIPYPQLPKTQKDELLTQQEIEVILEIKAEQKHYITQMLHIQNMIKIGKFVCLPIKMKGKKTEKQIDLKRYLVKSESTGEVCCTFILGRCGNTYVINFEINPSKLTQDHLDEIMALLTPSFNYDYVEVYNRGVVSHCEFFIDVSDVDISNLVLIDESRREKNFFGETTYQGKRGSPLVITMYDKAKELKITGKLVRIEVRLSRRDIRFKDLVESDPGNPFCKIFVVDVNGLHSVANQFNDPQLAIRIKELGVYGAIKNKHARKKVIAMLREVAVPCWKPDEFWVQHRELLQGLRPKNFAK